MAKLDRSEKELVESVERGECKSVRRLESERRCYQRYAEATFKKSRRVNIRISQEDLDAMQKRALFDLAVCPYASSQKIILVFDCHLDRQSSVKIVAIGVKERNRVRIGREMIEL